uniref:Putative secreted protein n=1 Tax=Ixodes ricinus TaxID=34613 RepID=A0A6B0UDC5_IXORI
MPGMVVGALLLGRTSRGSNRFSGSLRVRLGGSLLWLHLASSCLPAVFAVRLLLGSRVGDRRDTECCLFVSFVSRAASFLL